jgi:hypothetical protein
MMVMMMMMIIIMKRKRNLGKVRFWIAFLCCATESDLGVTGKLKMFLYLIKHCIMLLWRREGTVPSIL